MTASGAMWPTGPYATQGPPLNQHWVFGCTGPGGYDYPATLSNEDAEIVFDIQNENEVLKVNGSIRQIALLILQKAQSLKGQQSYSYGGQSFVPKNVVWG